MAGVQSAGGDRFDADYYQRFYGNPATRVMPHDIVERLARFLTSYIEYLEIPVNHILEFGPGTGALRDALSKEWPSVRHTGVELSAYACKRYGWRPGSVTQTRPVGRFELTVCYDVLQYLSDEDAEKALENLIGIKAPLIFFSALTAGDMAENCDPQLTDNNVFLRSVDWYRERLTSTHLHLGGGLWMRRDCDIVVFELEHS